MPACGVGPDIQPDNRHAGRTAELINVLHVLCRLIELESAQAELLNRICTGEMVSAEELRAAGAFEARAAPPKAKARVSPQQPELLD